MPARATSEGASHAAQDLAHLLTLAPVEIELAQQAEELHRTAHAVAPEASAPSAAAVAAASSAASAATRTKPMKQPRAGKAERRTDEQLGNHEGLQFVCEHQAGTVKLRAHLEGVKVCNGIE